MNTYIFVLLVIACAGAAPTGKMDDKNKAVLLDARVKGDPPKLPIEDVQLVPELQVLRRTKRFITRTDHLCQDGFKWLLHRCVEIKEYNEITADDDYVEDK